MPVVSDCLRSLFNRHRKPDLTKRVNTDNTVRQYSRDSAINNNDNNFVTCFYFPKKFKSLYNKLRNKRFLIIFFRQFLYFRYLSCI